MSGPMISDSDDSPEPMHTDAELPKHDLYVSAQQHNLLKIWHKKQVKHCDVVGLEIGDFIPH